MKELKEKLQELFKEMSISDLVNVHREYCDATNCFDDEIYSMDDFDEVIGEQEPWWIACRIFYGDFNPNDDYFTFNGYGNLKSLNSYNASEYIYINDIIDHIIENHDALYNDEIEAILDEYEAIEERAEMEEDE